MLRCLIWSCMFLALAVSADPTFVNPGFEEGTDQPKGWNKALHGEKFVLRRDATGGRNGTACAYLEGQQGHGDRACYLQVSAPFAPAKGLRLRVWYRGEGTATGILRVRSAPGVEVPGNEYGTSHFQMPLPKEEWTEFVFEVGLSTAARTAEQVRAEVILYQRGEGVIRYDDVSVESLENYQPRLSVAASPTICPRRPEDGRTVLQNPPDFWWTPQDKAASYTLQLSTSEGFEDGKTTTVDGVKYNVYSHDRTLVPGLWFWRVRFVDGEGMISSWTDTWRFTVSEDATPFPIPSATDMLRRIPQSHPRVYITTARSVEFRPPWPLYRSINSPISSQTKERWKVFSGRLDAYLGEETVREPGPEFADHKAGGLTDAKVKLGQKLRGLCSRATSRMQALAFGYQLTGDERYAAAAIEQADEMAGWDPAGVTSYQNHDQVFRDIAWKLATTYDWCHDRMTDAQRAKIRAAVVARGKVLFRDFTAGHTICEYPFDSHGITAYGFLGICAIALAHDAPEADEWFQFIAATYPAIFPPWGGEEGGWAQGCAYWKWSQPFAWWFYDALESSTGVDLYQKSFSRNNGWFKLYMHPPWSDRHHFGDGNHGPPGTTDASNLAHFAKVWQNPYFQWYADQISWQDSAIFSYWWYDDALAARPPADLPPGRYFPDIGWVAMHSDLSDPDEVFLAFKSSPFGSFNHSHADQNSFVLYAYGEPLLIDSGYYDWYGSPHDKGWTRQTKAHNAILVNGQGQPIFDITAKGRILRHFTSPVADMAVGDATVAYKGLLKQAKRTIFYLRPDIFVIVDDLVAPEPATFSWILHAEKEMELRPEVGEIVVRRGAGQCLVKFLTPEKLELSQTDQFDPPPTTPRANEWHARAKTATPATSQRFITVLAPFRAGEAEPQITWDGNRLVRAGKDVRDEITLDLSGEDVSLIAQGTRTGRAYSFASSPEGNVAMAFSLESGRRQLTGVWRDTPGPLAIAHAGVDLAMADGQGEWRSAEAKEAAKAEVVVTVDGKAADTPMQAMRAFDGGVLAWGKVPPEGEGAFRLQAVAGDVVLRLGQRRVPPGEMVWLSPGQPFSIRGGGNPLRATIALQSLVQDPTPMVAEIVPEPATGLKIEAEAYSDSGNGHAKVYSHRTFLSGGKGLETEVRAGQWVEWQFATEQEQRLELIAKAAVFEDDAQRLVELDGQPLGGTYRVHQLPNTGGFGATPEQWKHLHVGSLTVSPGKHTLRFTTVARKANLDCLLLVPATP